MKTKFTKGEWKVGNLGWCVVTDDKKSIDLDKRDSSESIKYYGGALICESCRTNDAKLIAAAPDLLVSSNTLIQAIKMRTSIGHDLIHEIIQVENAIKKAIG
jgi:hypothetical protein